MCLGMFWASSITIREAYGHRHSAVRFRNSWTVRQIPTPPCRRPTRRRFQVHELGNSWPVTVNHDTIHFHSFKTSGQKWTVGLRRIISLKLCGNDLFWYPMALVILWCRTGCRWTSKCGWGAGAGWQICCRILLHLSRVREGGREGATADRVPPPDYTEGIVDHL